MLGGRNENDPFLVSSVSCGGKLGVNEEPG